MVGACFISLSAYRKCIVILTYIFIVRGGVVTLQKSVQGITLTDKSTYQLLTKLFKGHVLPLQIGQLAGLLLEGGEATITVDVRFIHNRLRVARWEFRREMRS